MNSISTPGIILNRQNYKETDRLITIYTKKLGKIKARARGIRKTKSKLAGHLELFIESRLNLAEGKNWFSITGAVIEKSNSKIRESLSRLSKAYYLSELIILLTDFNEANEELYSSLVKALNAINTKDSDQIIPVFVINSLSHLGYKPELYKCVVSGEKLIPDDLRFSFKEGGLVDSHYRDINAIKISAQTVKMIRVSIKNIDLALQIKASPEIINEMTNIIIGYLTYILDKSPKSYSFLQEIKKMGKND